MGVPFAKIEELIEVCKKVDEKVYEDDWDKRIHVRDIQATLQKLIDDELAEMDKMAQEFEAQEISDQYERTRDMMDWPHGV